MREGEDSFQPSGLDSSVPPLCASPCSPAPCRGEGKTRTLAAEPGAPVPFSVAAVPSRLSSLVISVHRWAFLFLLRGWGGYLSLRDQVGRQSPLALPVAFGQNGHGFLLVGVEPGPQTLLQHLEDAGAARHAPELAFDAQQGYLDVKECLVVAADLAQEVPVVGPQTAGIVLTSWEGRSSHFLVDARQAVIKLVLVVEPDAADLVQLLRADQLKVAELGWALAGGPLRGFEHPPQPVLAPLLGVGAGDGAVVEQLHLAV